MVKKILFFLFACIIYNDARAQESFIIYNNDAERVLFKSANTSEDYIKLALVAEMSESEEQKIATHLSNDLKQIENELPNNQPPEKRLQKLLQILHSSFLKKYDEKALFNDVFNTGNYNSTDASILYAYILEQYHITYQIKEEPTRVYVLAYPATSNILLETIDPQKGYFAPDDNAKQNYINDLIKLKYLEENYVKDVGVERAFNDFFYNKGSITLKETVGLLYYNKAVQNFQLDKIDQAYSNILKATIFYPAKKCEFLQKAILLQKIQNLKFNELRDWQAITYASNNIYVNEETKKYLKFQFDDLVENKLWKEGKQESVDQAFNYLYLNLKDSTLKNSIEQTYYSEVGRYNLVANRYPEALQYLSKAIVKNPNNLLVKSMIMSVIVQKFLDQGVGSIHNINLLDQYIKEFSFLAADPVIRSTYIYNYSYLSYSAFNKEDKFNGEKYMQLMRNELDNLKPGTVKSEEQIGNVFGKASEYYYRTQGKQKALQILNAGLKYAPNSEQIARKIKVIVDSSKH